MSAGVVNPSMSETTVGPAPASSTPASSAPVISADLLNTDFFTLLGIPRRFALQCDTLDNRFRELQREVHPDRFAAADDAARRASMMLATQINEAYQTLRNPLKRAGYLLSLSGVDVGAESNTAMDPTFLMAQMEWREQVADARAAGDVAALKQLASEITDAMRASHEALAISLDEAPDTTLAAETVRRLMFLEKLHDEIDNAIFDLEDV